MEERLTPNELIQVRFLLGIPDLPLNFTDSMLSQESICFAKMTTTEETSVCREGRRVGRFEDDMFLRINEGLLFLRVTSPEQKYEKISLVREGLNNCIGKIFPSFSCVRHRFTSTDSEGRIEKQNSLLCPTSEVTIFWSRYSEISLNFFKNIHE